MNIPPELQKFNLQHAKRPLRRRLVCTSQGGPKVGKTSFFLRTAPRPALSINLDLNDEGIREEYAKDPDIVFKDIVVPPFIGKHTEDQRVKDMKIYEEVRNLYNLSVTKEYFRSIMIDEGSALYTLVRRAFLVDLDYGGSSQQSYAGVNSAMDRFYTLAKQSRVNLYIPHRLTDERENYITEEKKKGSRPTGRQVAGGWKQSLYTSQCHLVMTKDENFNMNLCAGCNLPRKAGKEKGCTCDKFRKRDYQNKFEAYIHTCTANARVEGMMLIGEDINWATLGQLVYPHSEESDWV